VGWGRAKKSEGKKKLGFGGKNLGRGFGGGCDEAERQRQHSGLKTRRRRGDQNSLKFTEEETSYSRVPQRVRKGENIKKG
jgi:hypothetical protein